MVECPSCGVENPPNAELCRICGKELRAQALDKDAARCPYCGTLNPSDEKTCSVCRRLLSARTHEPKDRITRDVIYYPKPDISAKPRTKTPIIGGILLLFVGLGSLGWTILVTLISVVELPEYREVFAGTVFVMWGLSLFMIVGAVAAFKRVWWPLAVGGAVAALLMTFLFVSAFCLVFTGISFVALLLLVLSKLEFS